jgi:hypothetical protein
MTTESARFESPSARDQQDTRQAKVAPLLAAGMSVRAISAETGIPDISQRSRAGLSA